jgi:hypothetical protein
MRFQGYRWMTPCIGCFLAVLPIISYIGEYYCTIIPVPHACSFGQYTPDYTRKPFGVLPFSSHAFFGPMHKLDRRLRPTIWGQ